MKGFRGVRHIVFPQVKGMCGQVRTPTHAPLQGPSTLMRLIKHRRGDPDWSDVDFRLVGQTPIRPVEADVLPILYTSWDRLPETLERDVNDRIPGR